MFSSSVFFLSCGIKSVFKAVFFMKVSIATSEKIKIISFLATLAVVVIHCKRLGSGLDFQRNPLALLQLICSDSFVRCSVPWFFVVSGFFFVWGKNSFSLNDWGGQIRKRLLSLYVPFLVWNACYFIMFDDNITLCGFIQRVAGLNYFIKPACVPFWYIRSVLLLMLLTPVIILPLLNLSNNSVICSIYIAKQFI